MSRRRKHVHICESDDDFEAKPTREDANTLRHIISQSNKLSDNDPTRTKDSETKRIWRARTKMIKAIDDYIAMQVPNEEFFFVLQRFDKSKYVQDIREYQGKNVTAALKSMTSGFVPIASRFASWEKDKSVEQNFAARGKLITKAVYDYANAKKENIKQNEIH